MPRNRHPKKTPPVSREEIEGMLVQVRNKVPTERTITHRESQQLIKETTAINIRTTPIVWGIPGDELMFFRFFSNFVRMGFMPWDTFSTTESTYLPSARNDIHDSFLDMHPDWKHLVFIDTDVLAPPWTVSQLLYHKLDCVGGWYNKKGPQEISPGVFGAVPAVYDIGYEIRDGVPYYSRFSEPGHGLQEVGAIGMGCNMISRKLAEDLGRSPFHMNSGGEDMVICKKITDLGYKIWVDWELHAAHCGVSYV